MSGVEAKQSSPGVDVSRSDHRELLHSALETIERLQTRLDAAEGARTAPIAVVGMSCRFPGQASSPEDFWALMRDGRDAVVQVPPGRWDARACARLDEEMAARMPTQFGGFLDGIDQFDPAFFGIAPREVNTMDPQQRLVMEVSWEALERAGYAPNRLAGSPTGVFVGITTNDYAQVVREAGSAQLDVYFATGIAHNAAPGRISYLLGLRGPSMAVDTACSSSLTAVHLACQSLRSRECNMALAGGVNAMLLPDAFVVYAKWGMMAPDGRCKAFDAAADGLVRAEGCGMLVLKRLADALTDRDPILAVIRGSAVNQDGASGGFTVPNGLAQQAVIRQALQAAGLKPADIDYIEAHGTGTTLGDPIELEAIDAVLGEERPAHKPLVIGAVKTNIGHLESAAGIAGLIKAILALQHRQIPPNLHFQSLNPRITLRRLEICVPTQMMSWPGGEGPARAGVSSFGFSGTNAHVIVEEAPAMQPADLSETRFAVLTLSATGESALAALAARYAKRLAESPQIQWADACYTSNIGRAHFNHRLAVIAAFPNEAASQLAAAARSEQAAGVYRGICPRAGSPKVAFLFTGQGAQYAGMGRRLFAAAPVFRDALERCHRLLGDQLTPDLLSVIYPGEGSASPIDQTAFTQPALFAFEYAMSELWRSWGVVPEIALGHSLGEYVAACIAGVFSLEDALRLVSARGRLMQALPAGGAMAAVFAAEPVIAEALSPYRDQLSIAALNSPAEVVISGHEKALSEVLTSLKAQAIGAKRLSVSHAFHSPLIEPMLEAFGRVAEQVHYSRPSLPIVSNITGKIADPAEIMTPAYWQKHVRAAVRFADGVATAAAHVNTFLELGPRPTLIGMARNCLPVAENTYIPSCHPKKDDLRQITEALAEMYAAGVAVDWDGVHHSSPCRRVILPTYPFQRTRQWIASGDGREGKHRADSANDGLHPFLQVHIALADTPHTHVFEGDISLDRFPYLKDHSVQGRVILPGAAFSEMAVAAKRLAFGEGAVALENVKYDLPMPLDDKSEIKVQVRLEATVEGTFRFAIASRSLSGASRLGEGEWRAHVRGELRDIAPAESPGITTDELNRIRARCTNEIAGEDFYRHLEARGNQWGPTFQGIDRLWRGEREVLGLISVPDAIRGDLTDYVWHPAVSDSCSHPLAAANSLERSEGPRGGAMVGGSMEELRIYRAMRGKRFWIHARLRDDDNPASNVLSGDLSLFDESLTRVSDVYGARLWYLDESSPMARGSKWTYSVAFEPVANPSAELQSQSGVRRWLILADQQGIGLALVQALQRAGEPVKLFHRAAADAGEDSAVLDPKNLAAAISSWNDGPETATEVVHLWGLDRQLADSARPCDVEDALSSGAESSLLCMQQLAQLQTPSARLWVVTRAAHRIGADDKVDPAQAATWGLARSFAAEYPSLWGGIVDLQPATSAADIASLLADTLRNSRNENQLALRDGQRLGARLVRERLLSESRFTWRSDATYLITGGLGGLGLAVATWLVHHGVRHLALIGRTPLPPHEQWHTMPQNSRQARRVQQLEQLEAMGTRVFVGYADVGDEASLTAFLRDLSQSGWPDIRGVIHAAGVMSYQSFREATLGDFRDTLHAKAIGAWLLHKATLGQTLDCFVMFSSSAAVLNVPFVGAYAAANAFMDGLAHRRAEQALPCISVNWGLWRGTGMGEDVSGRELEILKARGMDSIPADSGVELFGLLVQQKSCQLAVMPMDWGKWKSAFPAVGGLPFFSRVIGAVTENELAAHHDVRTAIAAATAEERAALLHACIRRHIADVLGLSESTLDDDTSITRLGLDSLMATELRNRLLADTGCTLPLVRLLEGPSTTELVALLGSVLDGAPQSHPLKSASAAARASATEAARILDDLDQLSEEDVDRLLDEMLREKEIEA